MELNRKSVTEDRWKNFQYLKLNNTLLYNTRLINIKINYFHTKKYENTT